MKAVKKTSRKARAPRPAKPTRTAMPAKTARPAAAPARVAAAAKPAAPPARVVAPKAGGRAAAARTTGRPAPLQPAARPAPPKPPPPVIGAKQLDVFRRLLHERKRDLADMYNRNKTYGRLTEDEGTQDLADKASNAYTKEFLYSLSNTDREVLQKVDEALVRLETVGFGQCLECGAEINRKRLEAVPWASHCIICQEKKEKGLL
jgi:RNA polymerase-binding protein DksA